MDTVYSLIEKEVDEKGELHLEAGLTKILLRWMRFSEDFNEKTVSMLPELQRVLGNDIKVNGSKEVRS